LPNHLNILIAADELVTAKDLGLTLEEHIRFCEPQMSSL
jgi:hypothetical protein